MKGKGGGGVGLSTCIEIFYLSVYVVAGALSDQNLYRSLHIRWIEIWCVL